MYICSGRWREYQGGETRSLVLQYDLPGQKQLVFLELNIGRKCKQIRDMLVLVIRLVFEASGISSDDTVFPGKRSHSSTVNWDMNPRRLRVLVTVSLVETLVLIRTHRGEFDELLRGARSSSLAIPRLTLIMTSSAFIRVLCLKTACLMGPSPAWIPLPKRTS